jgi:hypothetical protein
MNRIIKRNGNEIRMTEFASIKCILKENIFLRTMSMRKLPMIFARRNKKNLSRLY